MTLAPGARLGPYEVIGSLGAGGMGEVYRARDLRLRRAVAIKVLSPAFAADPDRLVRFEQEARAAAALDHPNILAVHDLGQHDGSPFIVTELLDGETLRDALRDGALPPRRAIDIGAAISQGLAAAHDRGIVHRDLKPENVFLTADGRVKILDFGIAKLTQPESASAGTTLMPTAPSADGVADTAAGMVLGTIGYMSPEQVRGAAAGPRSDIFSLGVLLHEMLSGRRPFGGDTTADVISGILKDAPPDLPIAERRIPPALARIVGRCLEKNPAARFQSARDLAFALEALTATTGPWPATVPDTAPPRRGRLVAAVAGLIIGLGLLAAAAWTLAPGSPDEPPVVRLSIDLPAGDSASSDMPNQDMSADGRYVVFVAEHAGVRQLMLRPLDRLAVQTLPGTDGAVTPFFSPDAASIAFFARGRLRTIGLSSLEIRDLADAPTPRGGWWADDGFIYYAPGRAGIMKVASGGGEPLEVTTVDRTKGEISHRWPQVLPGGRAMLLTVWTGPARDNRLVQLHQFETGARETVATGAETGRYVRSGHVLFGRLDALMAVPFDLERLAVTGPAVRTGTTVRIGSEGANYAVSSRGDLVHLPGDERRTDAQMVWVDRSGGIERTALPAQSIANTIISPDGTRAALNLHGPTSEIGVFDFQRGSLTPLTSDTGGSQAPVWSPDGHRIAYRGTRQGFRNVWVKPVDGTGREQQVTQGDNTQTPLSWSSDGKHLLYVDVDPVNGGDLWILSADDWKAEPLVVAPLSQYAAQFSPDSRWIAYVSEESGRAEVFVLPFPLTGQRWRISTSGGDEPAWSPDGRELFYRGEGQVMAVAIQTSPGFSASVARPLFADTFVASPNSTTGYAVARDGRLLFPQRVMPDPPITSVHVVLNWLSELRQGSYAAR